MDFGPVAARPLPGFTDHPCKMGILQSISGDFKN